MENMYTDFILNVLQTKFHKILYVEIHRLLKRMHVRSAAICVQFAICLLLLFLNVLKSDKWICIREVVLNETK